MRVWTQADELATRRIAELAFNAGKAAAGHGGSLMDTLVGNELQEIWYKVHDAVAELGEPTCDADVERARSVADLAVAHIDALQRR